MNDPFTSAISSIGQNLQGVATGNNSLFSPQVANLFGFNIPGVPLISARDFFLTQMESWFTSIPLTTQWLVLINQYPSCINTSILQGLERTDASKNGFDIDRAFQILTAFPLQKITGCLFAQGVNIPNEEFGVEYINPQNNRGFTPAPISLGRKDPGLLTIDFLETNTSFIDFVIRPWVITGSHFGFVARNPNDAIENAKNVKTTVTVMQYTRTFQKVSMIPRKIWNFYNCAPVAITDQSMTYDTEGFTSGRNYFTSRWVYSHYTVANNLYFPLPTIINQIASGKLPQVTTTQTAASFNLAAHL